ncbi:MAG TPA: hypothetical protein P5295_14105, partial [Spirochaetota bacterium]|nr:hypothetical protein [Spirochaetota bacterium]
MKKYFYLIFIVMSFGFSALNCDDSNPGSDDKTITITKFEWVIENIDISYWDTLPPHYEHAFYNFF